MHFALYFYDVEIWRFMTTLQQILLCIFIWIYYVIWTITVLVLWINEVFLKEDHIAFIIKFTFISAMYS